MKYRKHLLAAIGCLLLGGVVFGALSTTINWRVVQQNTQYTAKLGVSSTGSLEVDGTTTLNGAVTQTGAQTYAADVTLDDGTTASPSLIFKDGTDQTATFTKADSGNLTMTIGTTDSLQVLTGNLAVGNGTPSTTMDGEDAYVEGTFEADGAARFDGAIDANSTANIQGALTLQAALLNAVQDYTTTATVTTYGATDIDGSGAGAKRFTGTLGSATVVGELKTVVMSDATTSLTLTVTNHSTSDPEVFLFDAVDEALLLLWTGTEWVTVNATGVSTP